MFVLGTLLSSCEKDSDDPANEFVVVDSSVVVKTLELEFFGSTVGGYEFWIDLLSPTVTVENGLWKNEGSILSFNVVSTSNTGIKSGEYEFITGKSNCTLLTAHHCINWVEDGEAEWVDITSGLLKVIRRGDNGYEISFKGVDELGNNVTAYYKGYSIFADFSSNIRKNIVKR